MHLCKYGNESCFPSLVTTSRPALLSPIPFSTNSPLANICYQALAASPPALPWLWLCLQQPPLLQKSVALFSATAWLCQMAAFAAVLLMEHVPGDQAGWFGLR